MNPYLLYSSLVLYLASGILFLLQLVFNRPGLARMAFRITLLGWVLQSALLAVFFIRAGYPFLVDAEASYLFTSWVVALTFLLIHWLSRLPLVGVFALPLVSTFYLLAIFASESYSGASATMQSPWASVHIMFSFLALAILSTSFILGIMFIIEEFQLKHKVLPKVFLRLPALDSLEQIHAKALSVGFVLLTGGIITGAIWAKSVTGFYFFEDARQLWAICGWLIYALFLQARFTAGWRGRRGVLLSLIGFAVILFTFLGVEHG